jgi:hypothetical protein
MFTRVAVVGAFTISRLRLLFFDIVRSRSEEERIQSANSKKKKGKNTSLSLSLSLGSVSIDSSYAMTRKAGGTSENSFWFGKTRKRLGTHRPSLGSSLS